MKIVFRMFVFILIVIQVPVMYFIWYPQHMKEDLNVVVVPVASTTLDPREQIEAHDIEWIELPSAYVPEQTILTEEELLGMYVSNMVVISKGTFFLQHLVADYHQLQDQPTHDLNDNQIAFSIGADFVQVSGNTLVENQRVDIYCVIPLIKEVPIVDVLLQGVRIIDVRDRLGLKLDDVNSTGVASVIVVALSQEHVTLLLKAQQVGSIQFYATNESWQSNQEDVLVEDSLVLPYLKTQDTLVEE